MTAPPRGFSLQYQKTTEKNHVRALDRFRATAR
jgi:hypothetical protein